MRGLDWSDERYARFYSRDTAEWLLLSWRARGLYGLLLRIVDRSGQLRLGRAGRRGVAACIQATEDADTVVAALAELEADGWIEIGDANSGSGAVLVLPEFLVQQEARASDKARQRKHRERRRDTALGHARHDDHADRDSLSRSVTCHDSYAICHTTIHPVTNRDESSRETDASHDMSHGVTPYRADPIHADLPLDDDSVGLSIARARTSGIIGGIEEDPEETTPPTAKSRRAEDIPAECPPGLQDWAKEELSMAGHIFIASKNESPPEAPQRPRIARVIHKTQWHPTGIPLLVPGSRTRELTLVERGMDPKELSRKRAEALAWTDQVLAEREARRQRKEAEGARKHAEREAESRPRATQVPHDEIATIAMGDPTEAMRALLRKAPHPIPLLAERSAERLASGLVGGQLRLSDVPGALIAAAMKLDAKLAKLDASAPDHDIEALHRVVAGFLAKAPMYRRTQAQRTEVTESGERLLSTYADRYASRFGRAYRQAEDDALHASAIAAELERQIATDTEAIKLDPARAKRRALDALLEVWFSDAFAQKSGHSLRQLARLQRDEPNRFVPQAAEATTAERYPLLEDDDDHDGRIDPRTCEEHAKIEAMLAKSPMGMVIQ